MAAQRALEPYKLTPDIKMEREKTLSSLPVEVLVSKAWVVSTLGDVKGVCGAIHKTIRCC